jgi:hypothetical protein
MVGDKKSYLTELRDRQQYIKNLISSNVTPRSAIRNLFLSNGTSGSITYIKNLISSNGTPRSAIRN